MRISGTHGTYGTHGTTRRRKSLVVNGNAHARWRIPLRFNAMSVESARGTDRTVSVGARTLARQSFPRHQTPCGYAYERALDQGHSVRRVLWHSRRHHVSYSWRRQGDGVTRLRCGGWHDLRGVSLLDQAGHPNRGATLVCSDVGDCVGMRCAVPFAGPKQGSHCGDDGRRSCGCSLGRLMRVRGRYIVPRPTQSRP